MNIVWAASARRDLQSIWNYVAKDSELMAGQFINELLSFAAGLTPAEGNPVPEYQGVLEVPFRSYRVVYRMGPGTSGERLEILAVHGTRRQAERANAQSLTKK